MKRIQIFLIVSFLIQFGMLNQGISQTGITKFEPVFESVEKANPVPEWFKDAKFGIYFHWGVYSVPAYSNEWYPRSMYIKETPENKHHIEIYGDPLQWPYHNFITGAYDKQGNFVKFAPKLKSEGGQFDPEEWAQLFSDAGARFAGPVAEHHDGFSLWASKVNPWNANDMGPKLDLVGLLTDAFRKKDIRIILSMHHAYNITGYFEHVPETDDQKLQMRVVRRRVDRELQMLYGQQGKTKNEDLWLAKHKEIIDGYKPDIIYQDFNLHRISQTVLLEFLSYYYNKAIEWDKQVVATFKDGLNTKCAVLDYERGGPPDLIEIYWLSDDAISASSWCYTKGLTYYSPKQLLHSLIDKVSKNGNLLLNISPEADGSIPKEQKEILLTIGDWLKKYGEAIYATRAWEMYGEGPTKMGAEHGVFLAPGEGTAKDIRYTRSKDNTTLYAILLGWEKEQKDIKLTLLGNKRIDLGNLKNIELIKGKTHEYIALQYQQVEDGLIINLPERSFDELAYVIKLSFFDKIPPLDKFAHFDSNPHYYLAPGNNPENLVLDAELKLIKRINIPEVQWKLEPAGKGIYKIQNRGNLNKVISCTPDGTGLVMSNFSGKDNQLWKIEHSFNGHFKITNKKFPDIVLSVNQFAKEGEKARLIDSGSGSHFGWRLFEVCEQKQEPFKQHVIPGTIEAEDYDAGCPGEAYYDKNEINEGGAYRLNEGVDIEKCSAGGYNVGWIRKGEFLCYSVTVSKSGTYQVSFNVASPYESGAFYLECDRKNITGTVKIPDTKGFQNWETVKTTVHLNAGQHIIKWVSEGDNFNIDNIVFELSE